MKLLKIEKDRMYTDCRGLICKVLDLGLGRLKYQVLLNMGLTNKKVGELCESSELAFQIWAKEPWTAPIELPKPVEEIPTKPIEEVKDKRKRTFYLLSDGKVIRTRPEEFLSKVRAVVIGDARQYFKSKGFDVQ